MVPDCVRASDRSTDHTSRLMRPTPRGVCGDEYRRCAGRGVAGLQRPAQQRQHAEKGEVVHRHTAAEELLGTVRRAEHDILGRAGDDLLERVDLLAVIEELRQLEQLPAAGPLRRRVADFDRDDAFGIEVERIEQNILDHAEDRRRGADAKRQRRDGNGAERRLSGEDATAMA